MNYQAQNASTPFNLWSTVKLVVIIPTYRHPVLLGEALTSALASKATVPFGILVCSDGCNFTETATVLQAFSLSDPRVLHLRKPNGGPSSARNFAIDYVLQNVPTMEAVFFLDADNRLSPTALQTGYDELVRAPDHGWIYTNIDAFGIPWNANYNVEYSPLLHIVHENICDTGCFVRRSVFESGARFDEDARSGFEDWDFWLQCLQLGYRGKHVSFGFYYRQRLESRFKEMNRSREHMLEYLRKRHRTIAAPKNLLSWEHETNPRYLLTFGSGRHVAFTDPLLASSPIDADELSLDISGYINASDVIWNPAFFLFGDQEIIEELIRLRLHYNILWLLERGASIANFVAVTFEYQSDEIRLEHGISQDPAEAPYRAALWGCSHKQTSEVLNDNETKWLRSITSGNVSPSIYEIRIFAPIRKDSIGGISSALRSVSIMYGAFDGWRASVCYPRESVRWIWRQQLLPPRHTYYDLLCKYLGADSYAPRAGNKKFNVGIVVPFGSFGGAEKVAYALAKSLRRHGDYAVHLFVLAEPKMKLVSEYVESFDTVNFLADAQYPIWGGPISLFGDQCYLPDAPQVNTPKVIGFLGALDAVVNCHSAPLNSVIGALKRAQVKTISYVHLADVTEYGRSAGHPYLAVGFEHSYDLVVTCSQALKRYLHALGAPGEKVMAIPNAASFQITEETRTEARRLRAEKRGARNLRCIFIGRLDRQKGVERVVAAIRACRLANLPVDFELIGGALLDSDDGMLEALRGEENVVITPPVYSTEELTRAYLGADVLVLPSRWEGAPLVILEAQQLGAIPVCTNVGAVSELIESDVDGIVLEATNDDAIVEQMVSTFRRLADDDGMRARISLTAINRAERASWDENFKPLLDWFDLHVS